MGQRLVINFYKDNKMILNMYQHWSGYTREALENCILIMEHLKDIKDEDLNRATIARTLCSIFTNRGLPSPSSMYRMAANEIKSCHAGLDDMDYNNKAIREELGIPLYTDRNAGIIAVSSKGMEETLGWAESSADININNMTCNVGKLFMPTMEEIKGYMNYHDCINLPSYADDIEHHEFDLIEMKDLLSFLNLSINKDFYLDSKGNSFMTIE